MSIYNDKKNKIGFFTEVYLGCRGRIDARMRAVRKGENGSLESPFIRKEISLCSAAMEEQKITLVEKLIEEHMKQESYNVVVNKHNIALRTINKNENYEKPDYLTSMHSIKNSNENINCFLEYHEKMSDKFAQDMRVHLINIEGCDVIGNIAKSDLSINKEYEITYIKCLKYVDVLFARLSAYWNGVLKCKSKGASYPTYFAYEAIKNELIAKLNEIKDIKLNNIESVTLKNEM